MERGGIGVHISSILQAWDEGSALQGELAAASWGKACLSSQGHLLFLFLSLQYRREGDLKGCLARGADGAEIAENGQTHGADIANLNETSVTEAGSPVIHVDWRRED